MTNGIDIVLHIHLNNYVGRKDSQKRNFMKDFSIYVPGDDFSNSEASQDLAKEVFC